MSGPGRTAGWRSHRESHGARSDQSAQNAGGSDRGRRALLTATSPQATEKGGRMLMMSRRAGEVILIGDDIEIVISRIGRSRVTVGIRAPRQTPVAAREIKLVEEENRTA